MTRNRVLTLLLALVLGGSFASAQEGRGARLGSGESLEAMRKRLNLTPEQEEKVRPILRESAEKLRALQEKIQKEERTRESRRGARREMETIQSETRAKLAGVLNEEQMKEYDKMRAETRDNRRRRARKQ